MLGELYGARSINEDQGEKKKSRKNNRKIVLNNMTEEFVKNSIIKFLSRKEWGTNLQFGELREKGVDIKVRHNRYSRYFLIECKG